MNMHTGQLQLTPAETALVEGFISRIAELPDEGATRARRHAAIGQIKAGLPTRRVEAWHYTDLRRLLAEVPAFDPDARAQVLEPLLAGSQVLAVVNGRAAEATDIEGVTLSAGLPEEDASFALSPDDAVGAVNTAFALDGFSLRIPEGAEIATPVELQNLHGGGQAHARFAVHAGAGSRATFVERQSGEGKALVSSVSEIEVEAGADIVWVILQEQPDDATHLGQFRARLGKDAKLTLFIMNVGGALVRQEVNVAAEGDDSVFTLRGANLLAGRTHCDVTMVLDHLGHGATSTETIRNVIAGRAHGVFQGQIRVAREAQKTDAKMACNTLLLSDDAEFSTKPELEIFADDVACGHGATVTEIDQDHLFYLMARGVPEQEARRLLIKAFLAEVVEDLDDEGLVDALEEKLEAWFARKG